MKIFQCELCAVVVAAFLSVVAAAAQCAPAQSNAGAQQTFGVTSKLVYLDVTVLDKKGRPVTTGLTQNDFQITEDKRPQKIFSFEAPQPHVAAGSDQSEDAASVRNILVLDQLNSNLQDFAYIRRQAQNFLEGQPKELRFPAELMVVGNRSVELVQGWTRSRADLLSALSQVRRDIPYKEMRLDFWSERIWQSVDALQEIAIENAGVPGRKNILWLGYGAPPLQTADMPVQDVEAVERYIHTVVNLMVDSRVSLYVMYPGLPPTGWVSVPVSNAETVENLNAAARVTVADPFAGEINFPLFAGQTGGKLFYNRVDLDTEMDEAEALGSNFYTLTYQPNGGDDNGRFRRIRVTMSNPELRAVTREGYYAPDRSAPRNARTEATERLLDAERANLPIDTLPVALSQIVRHPDKESADFTVRLPAASLTWNPGADGNSSTNLTAATASLNGNRKIIAAQVMQLTVSTHTQDTQHLEGRTISFRISVRVPKKAQVIRVAIETAADGKVGTADLKREQIDAAPPS